MNRKIEDYLFLYYGCLVKHPALKNPRIFQWAWAGDMMKKKIQVKPYLRPLINITSDEIDYCSFNHDEVVQINAGMIPNLNPRIVLYLLKQEFDLFHLIDDGLAIDKTKTENLK